jgi:uncharacterized membrane protein YbhN (UPF0104 family)
MSSWLVRAIVSLVVLAVLLTVIPLDVVLDALVGVSPWVWAASLVIFFAGHSLNALKLRLLMGPTAPSVAVFVRAQYAGLAANLGLPGLAGGELVRAACLVPAVGVKRVAVASVADRILDTATLVFMIVVALPLAGMPPAIAAVVRPGGWWLVICAAAGALVGAIGLRLARHTRVAKTIGEAWRDLAARRLALGIAILISLSVQAAFVLTNVWLAREVGVTTHLAAWFVAWPLSKLIAVLPISLGGLGVREAALVSLLAPYGADSNAVLASGLLWQAILAVSGLVGLAVTQVLRRKETPPGETTAGVALEPAQKELSPTSFPRPRAGKTR